MKKLSIAIFTDTLFSFICSYILFLALFKNYLTLPISVVLSVTISCIIALFTFKGLFKKRQKKISRWETEREKKATLFALNFYPAKKLYELFFKAYLKEGASPEIKKDGILLGETNTLVKIIFSFTEPTKKDILKFYNLLSGGKKGIIVCEKYSDEIKEFANRFCGKIQLYDGDYAYNLLKAHDTLPDTDEFPIEETKKNKFKIKNVFSKKSTKSLTAFGGLLLLTAFFVPIKIYYVLFGSAFLLIALFIKAFKKD